jgi:tetratricopeptide (TPR) repeat protein
MKPSRYLLVVGLLALTSAAAAAEGDGAVDKARASFFQGVELFKEGSFEAALVEFQKAYQTSPSYRILYNIAQTQFELRDYAAAYGTAKDYLEQGGGELPAARRADVEELLRKLEKRVALVTITCNVNDADLRIDDISVGKSPLAAPVLVNAGPRKLSAVRPGYAVTTRVVSVGGGEQATVRLDLVAPIELLTSKPTVAPPPPFTVVPEASERPAGRSRAGLITSLSVASGCAIATGVFGWQMLLAKSDFDHEVAKTPYDRAAVDRARSRALTYQYLTDGFAAATLLASGVALYLVFSDDGAAQRSRGKTKHALLLAPAGAGMVLHGAW